MMDLKLRMELEARIQQLLEANTAEVERRRFAELRVLSLEATVRALQSALVEQKGLADDGK